MTELRPPLPQPVGTPPTPGVERVPQVGELTPMWTIALLVTWAMVVMSYMAVWKASEELGIGTWWLGPRSDPQPTVVNLIPFVIVALVGIAAGIRLRHLPWISIAGSTALIVVAIPDLSRSTGLAVIEFAIGGAAMIVSLVSLTGRYRNSPEAASDAGR